MARPSDFNKVNNEILALADLSQVDRRFLNRASRKWWKYAIAREFGISPAEVEGWSGEDVAEALANIAQVKAIRKEPKQRAQGARPGRR